MNPLFRDLLGAAPERSFDDITVVDANETDKVLIAPRMAVRTRFRSSFLYDAEPLHLAGPSPFSRIATFASLPDGDTLFVVQEDDALQGATVREKFGNDLIDTRFWSVMLVYWSEKKIGLLEMVTGFLNGQFVARHAEDPKNETIESYVTNAVCLLETAIQRVNCHGGAVYRPVPNPKNASRIAKGKKPLYDWTTVTISPRKPERSEPKGGTHASPRRHQRRGHYRTYKSGKRVWVNEMWVGSAANGTVFHDYKVTG